MESAINLEAICSRIAMMKKTAMELEALGEDIPSLSCNTARILASLKMLEIGFSDLEDIDAAD